ncbi:MAG: hypothetical protein A2Z52_01500 [Candidatus Moranbacteria bacterium RBG_19FT_COMBO_42_6]|nr:MAG: hypothetical protein A2Z52_01500 [Candidatus Moranbacteria bacterium RBG_19FT_COMBO_42_6]
MRAPEIYLKKEQIFEIFVLFWVSFGWLALFASLLGIFYNVIFIVYIFLGALAFLIILPLNREKIQLNRFSLLIIVFSLLVIVTFAHYSTPTVFSGRDQGSFSEAAIRLAQNHQLKFSTDASREFFKIYGPGRALNFPGFDYANDGQLITQFPLSYTSWLAAFYGIFGLNGLAIANGVSFFIFLLSFYAVSRNFIKFRIAFLSLIFIASSFVFSWFFKFTVSENLALMLLWFGIYEFMLFLKNEKRFHFFSFFSAVGLLTFSRIEALAFLAVAVAILLFKNKNWKNLIFVKIGRRNLTMIAAAAVLYGINMAVNINAYTALIKGAIKPFLFLGTEVSGSNFFLMPLYVFKIFMAYALLGFIVVGIIGVIYFARRRNFSILVPFFIVLPSFIYLLQPAISVDHPWMLRRFLFAIIPASILYTAILLENFLKKHASLYFISAILLFTNLLVFSPYIKFSPNKDLLAQVGKISRNFEAQDLVLVDQAATGDGWSMMTGPMSFLYGKQAVYFFNPADLEKLDLKKFSNIYLVIPDENVKFYNKSAWWEKISVKNSYEIKNMILDSPMGEKRQTLLSQIYLPEKKEIDVQGKIYLLKK